MYPILLLSLLLFLLAHTTYRYLLHPLLTSPLRHLPAPNYLARISPLWILWQRYQGRENRALQKAHARLGPVVLVGCGEVSVNCVRGGLSVVYAGGMEKGVVMAGSEGRGLEEGNWYGFFRNFGQVRWFS
jgi:hypothetical protein